MSLEARMELLTAAVIELTAAIGAMQAPGPVEERIVGGVHFTAHTELKKPGSEPLSTGSSKSTEKQSDDSQNAEALNAPSSTDTTSGQQSAQTGESSSQEQTQKVFVSDPKTPDAEQRKEQQEAHDKGFLTYIFAVKPATLKLSKEKGREVTIAVLARFGVKGAQELAASQWADYIAHCEKVLAGGEV